MYREYPDTHATRNYLSLAEWIKPRDILVHKNNGDKPNHVLRGPMHVWKHKKLWKSFLILEIKVDFSYTWETWGYLRNDWS
jgi:hypothetical protein